tara:strand:+ start:17 stop:271 length:255 start_codon:yes stop_codon:yes gene_type:complete
MDTNKKFFIVEKWKTDYNERYTIHSDKMYDLTTAVRKLLALDTLNEEKRTTSYHLQEVSFSEVQEPLILKDEVKEDKEQMDMPF